MSTPTGHCPRCERTVVLRREEIDMCLCIVLFFTIIGGIIYLIIYFNKPIDRCVQCNTRISYIDSNQYSQQQYQNQYNQTPSSPQNEIQSLQSEEPVKDDKKYCQFCGEKVNPGTKHCPNCGART